MKINFTLILLLSVVHQNACLFGKIKKSLTKVGHSLLNFSLKVMDGDVRPIEEKLQTVVSDEQHFPCDVTNTRSLEVPKSVHELRPGDIDVVAAIGDSITAGVGVMATTVRHMLNEERGKSFSIGGEGTWREHTTLPNILKVFNPNLTGYSLNQSRHSQHESQFNVARKSTVSADIPSLARMLVDKIKSDEEINIDDNWKMITIFMGANDFCSKICYMSKPRSSLKEHRKRLIRVLRILKENLPRTLVNILPAPNLQTLVESQVENRGCHITRFLECPCFFAAQYKKQTDMLYEILREWQAMEIDVSNLEEFDGDDFAVVAQPFTVNYTFPENEFGMADETYFAPDCFHFSQKMHARIANDLWNNIMEPVGNKSSDGNGLFEKFNCPTQENPYIYTKRNSGIK